MNYRKCGIAHVSRDRETLHQTRTAVRPPPPWVKCGKNDGPIKPDSHPHTSVLLSCFSPKARDGQVPHITD